MAKGFTISLSGLQKTLSNLQKEGGKILDDCDDEIAASAEMIARSAKINAPKDMGFLGGRISANPVKKLTWEVVAQSEYAAYMEFGTKKKVQIPAGLSSYAAQFRGARKSKVNPWKAISAWCKRQGIEKEKWWFIYREIMTNGVNAHPFLFPAVFKERPILVKNLVNVIKKKREI
jgi:hypothetical protein